MWSLRKPIGNVVPSPREGITQGLRSTGLPLRRERDSKECMNVHVDIMGARLGLPDGEISMHTHYIKEINSVHHSLKTC